MFVYVILIFCSLALSTVSCNNIVEHQATKRTIFTENVHDKANHILQDIYTTIELNIYENTPKLKLEDFSWGIFSGEKGRLQGFHNFQLVNNNTLSTTQKSKMNASFEFTVPSIRAVWEKSSCLGYSCDITIELQNAVFILQMKFDATECVIDHLAYLKNYDNAISHANYSKISPVSRGILEATVHLLSKVLTTKPFEKIVKDNVNHALLQLPLFKPKDIKRLCSVYQEG